MKRKYSNEFFIEWMKKHNRLPTPKRSAEEARLAMALNFRRKRDKALDDIALTFRRKKGDKRLGYKGEDLQKLGMFLAESGGMGWF